MYRIVLAAIAPEKVDERDKEGWARQYEERLEIGRDSPPFIETIALRSDWDRAVQKQQAGELVVGALVTCRKGKGKGSWVGRGQITSLEPDGSGVVCLAKAKGKTENEPFQCAADLKIRVLPDLYVGAHVTCQAGRGELVTLEAPSGPGIVRLDLGHGSYHDAPFLSAMHYNVRVVPPPFMPKARSTRKDALSDSDKNAVKETYHEESATSPRKKDKIRKKVAPYTYIKTQAMFLMNTLAGTYAAFKTNFPHYSWLSFSAFAKEKPWYVREINEECCLCEKCENYSEWRRGWRQLGPMLKEWIKPENTTHDGDIDCTVNMAKDAACRTDPRIKKLLDLANSKENGGVGDSKAEAMKHLLCKHVLPCCLNGTCKEPDCGFSKIWSDPKVGLRKDLVDENGKIKSDIDPFWLRKISWWSYGNVPNKETAAKKAKKKQEKKKAKDKGDVVDEDYHGKKDKTSRLEKREQNGTIIEFLDQWEPVALRTFEHRHTLEKCRQSETQFKRTAPIGTLWY